MSALSDQAMNVILVAYCRAKGIESTLDAVRKRDGNFAEFMCWVSSRRAEWRAKHGGREPVQDRDRDAWVAHCEAAAEAEASRG